MKNFDLNVSLSFVLFLSDIIFYEKDITNQYASDHCIRGIFK